VEVRQRALVTVDVLKLHFHADSHLAQHRHLHLELLLRAPDFPVLEAIEVNRQLPAQHESHLRLVVPQKELLCLPIEAFQQLFEVMWSHLNEAVCFHPHKTQFLEMFVHLCVAAS